MLNPKISKSEIAFNLSDNSQNLDLLNTVNTVDLKIKPELNKPIITINNLTIQRGGLAVLSNLNLTIPTGSNSVIIGPNGAGKTSFLLSLAGVIKYQGQIRFASVNKQPKIAFVPQHLIADKNLPLTVQEFFALQSKRPLWLGLSQKVKQQTKEFLSLVKAEHLLDRPLAVLSGGESRKVLLASALAQQPEILLLDEPDAGVDVRGEQDFWQLLNHTRKQFGFTQIMISHNLALAAHHATYIIALNRKLVATGSAKEVLTSQLLMELFGMPVHLYPNQCLHQDQVCQDCGAICGIQTSTDANSE